MITLTRLDNSVAELLRESLALFGSFKHVYLFGSAIDPSIINNDIDILVTYIEYSDRIGRDMRFIADELEKAYGQPVDLTALSIEEERDIAFLKKLKSHYLKIK